MNDIFEDLLDQAMLLFTLMISSSFMIPFSPPRPHTRCVTASWQVDLYLKPEKCSFDKTSIEYLGVIIADGQVRMDPAKVAGITQCLSYHGQRDPGLSRLLQLLTVVLLQLLCHCTPSLRLNLERHCLPMDPAIKLRLPHLFPSLPKPCPCLA